jgi:hypothetical protein
MELPSSCEKKNQNFICVIHMPVKNNFLEFCYVYTDGYQQDFKTIAWSTQKTYASTTTSTMLCNTATSSLSTLAPPQHCSAPRLLITRRHGLYINLVVRHE